VARFFSMSSNRGKKSRQQGHLWPKRHIVLRSDIEAHNPIIGETRLRCRVVLTMVDSDDGRIERKNDFHDYWLMVYPTNSIHRITFHKQYRLSNVPLA
jgi:hypothetical protein